MYKSKRSQATDIPKSVKDKVWQRDEHRCIFCGSSQARPESHIIPRSSGGIGVEQNIITVCRRCHTLMDQSTKREKMVKSAMHYIENIYGNIDWSDYIYDVSK